VTDVNFSLAVMTYDVGGVAFDGGTGSVLAGVAIAENGVVLVTTGADGAFHVPLANGTISLVASHPPNGPVVYGSVPFSVRVSGALDVHDLTIPRTVVPLTGAVVDAATGRAVGTASVALWGGGGNEVSNASTEGSGAFAFAVGPGNYNVSVSAPGYEPTNVTVATGPAGTRTTVALVEVAAARSSSTAVGPGLAVAAGVAAVAAVGIGVLLWRRGRRPPPGERYYAPGEPYDSGDAPPT
jgi:hypothetical protein